MCSIRVNRTKGTGEIVNIGFQSLYKCISLVSNSLYYLEHYCLTVILVSYTCVKPNFRKFYFFTGRITKVLHQMTINLNLCRRSSCLINMSPGKCLIESKFDLPSQFKRGHYEISRIYQNISLIGIVQLTYKNVNKKCIHS